MFDSTLNTSLSSIYFGKVLFVIYGQKEKI